MLASFFIQKNYAHIVIYTITDNLRMHKIAIPKIKNTCLSLYDEYR